jgi:phenylacetate-CoA ligase
MFFEQELECMNRDSLELMQLERLHALLGRVIETVPMYRERFGAAGIKPDDIHSLADLEILGFTTKEDIRNNYPYGLFAVPMKQIVRLHASSGTTGKPTVVGYTRNDIENWSRLVARLVIAAGANDEDIAHIAFGYGLFTGALGLHYGLEKIGAAIVPASSGNTEKNVSLMQDFGATILISTPSYALHMAEVAEEIGFDPPTSQLRLGLFGSEGCSEEYRLELEKRWGIVATENYGLSEILGPGVSGECEARTGMHIAEDHFLAEIIDPITGRKLGWGEKGELVLSTLTKEGIPLLRYRTRDITVLHPEPCACGRTHARMERVQGRSDDMLKIRGVNVFPSQIESVLMNIAEIGPHYQIIVTRKGYMDEIEIDVELMDGALLESFRELETLERKVREKLRVFLSIDARVRLVEPKSITRTAGKAQRIVDKRPK